VGRSGPQANARVLLPDQDGGYLHDPGTVRSASSSAPPPSSAAVARRMRATPQRDTAPELALRRAVHALGLRYWVHRAPLKGLRRRADLVFPKIRVAVFLDGCFWHGCPLHATSPRANGDWWERKIQRNRRRDVDTTQLLERAGWTVVRVWEHEDVGEAALRVAESARARRPAS
jgi:DNA mismatch endonuclease (patch repair protein)